MKCKGRKKDNFVMEYCELFDERRIKLYDRTNWNCMQQIDTSTMALIAHFILCSLSVIFSVSCVSLFFQCDFSAAKYSFVSDDN